MGLHLSDVLLPTLATAAFDMSTILGYVWVGIQVALGVGMVIFVHELGHFLVAKWCGVKCEKFYLGFDIFGIKLFHFQWGETEYGIGLLPLGGYVKMLGQDDNPARMSEEIERAKLKAAAGEELPPDLAAQFDPRSYLSQSVPRRMAIISAGVIMNVIFAFLVCAVAYQIGVRTSPCEVAGVRPGSPAWIAGLEPGDKITQIGDRKNPEFRHLTFYVALRDYGDQGVPITIEREGLKDAIQVHLVPEKGEKMRRIGVLGGIGLELNETEPVRKETPADRRVGGFQGGDKIVGIDDTPIKNYGQLVAALAAKATQPIKVKVLRKVAAAQGAAKPEEEIIKEVVVDLAANPMQSVGLQMAMGTITAIQKDSPAAKAGLKTNDLIRKVNGAPVGDPMTLPNRLFDLAGQSVTLEVQRENRTVEIQLTPLARPAGINIPLTPFDGLEVPAIGVTYRVLSTIESVAAEAVVKPVGNAKLAELAGAEIVSAVAPPFEGDTKPIPFEFSEKKTNWPFFYHFLQKLQVGDTVRFKMKSGAEFDLTVYAAKDEYNPDRGFNLNMLTVIRKTSDWQEAFSWAYDDTIEFLTQPYRMLMRMVTGDIGTDNLGGPIRIMHIASVQARLGPGDLLFFLAMLSANLAVINFLPIPVLDGGHMVFLTWELVRGRPANERVMYGLTMAGVFFLIGLMCLVTVQDVGHYLGF